MYSSNSNSNSNYYWSLCCLSMSFDWRKYFQVVFLILFPENKRDFCRWGRYCCGEATAATPHAAPSTTKISPERNYLKFPKQKWIFNLIVQTFKEEKWKNTLRCPGAAARDFAVGGGHGWTPGEEEGPGRGGPEIPTGLRPLAYGGGWFCRLFVLHHFLDSVV